MATYAANLQVRNEVKLLAHKRKEELDPDDCIYDEVLVLSIYHFVQKSKPLPKKKLKRIWDTLTFKSSNFSLIPSNTIKASDEINQWNEFTMPDREYIELLEDFADIISLYKNSFFSSISKVKVNEDFFK